MCYHFVVSLYPQCAQVLQSLIILQIIFFFMLIIFGLLPRPPSPAHLNHRACWLLLHILYSIFMNFVFHLFISSFLCLFACLLVHSFVSVTQSSSYFNVEDSVAASLAFSMFQIILWRFAARDFSGQFYWSSSALSVGLAQKLRGLFRTTGLNVP